MSKIGIISTVEEPKHLLRLLTELGVENPIVHIDEPELKNHFLVTVCEWLIIDQPSISFDFLKLAIRNSCQILFLKFPRWTTDELIEIHRLCDEAKVQIFFHDELICKEQNLERIKQTTRTTLIDCNLLLAENANAELVLFRTLLLLVMLDNSDFKRLGITLIPPYLIDLRFNLHSSSVLRALLQTSSQSKTSGFITLYRAQEAPHFFSLEQSTETLKNTLESIINSNPLDKPYLPNLNHYIQVDLIINTARKKADYADFFTEKR
ncbi:MAG: hypothetical protein ACK5JS_00470 [Mangrovibacterium sp.]